MGILYLIATPIGNLEDITLRALRLLGEVSMIAAEDTRTAQRLLHHFQISNHLLSYTEHNRRARIPQIVRLLETGDVALISEAGTPAVSDPGQELVAAAVAAGHNVSAAPGASSVVTALVLSGLSTRQFVFLGFLPRQPGERRTLLRTLTTESRTLICFEAPSRLNRSLADILACLGDRRVALCRELTKLHEEVVRVRVSEALARSQEPRGEFTLVIEGASDHPEPEASDGGREKLLQLREAGRSAREAVAEAAAELGLPRRRLYREWLTLLPPEGDKAGLW